MGESPHREGQREVRAPTGGIGLPGPEVGGSAEPDAIDARRSEAPVEMVVTAGHEEICIRMGVVGRRKPYRRIARRVFLPQRKRSGTGSLIGHSRERYLDPRKREAAVVFGQADVRFLIGSKGACRLIVVESRPTMSRLLDLGGDPDRIPGIDSRERVNRTFRLDVTLSARLLRHVINRKINVFQFFENILAFRLGLGEAGPAILLIVGPVHVHMLAKRAWCGPGRSREDDRCKNRVFHSSPSTPGGMAMLMPLSVFRFASDAAIVSTLPSALR